jgi:hypothetical protein
MLEALVAEGLVSVSDLLVLAAGEYRCCTLAKL